MLTALAVIGFLVFPFVFVLFAVLLIKFSMYLADRLL